MCHIQSATQQLIHLLPHPALSQAVVGLTPQQHQATLRGSCMLLFRLIMTHCINRDQPRLGLVSTVH